ncbi:unnamed protein product [Tuber aestivum]|uniref:Uncharacterized protein n=1 Tax=Tuber aestivum TaxID=59557 RepID=A0A292PPA0_9PEZI|nr:unnamed protein product [Tuber aestivum]
MGLFKAFALSVLTARSPLAVNSSFHPTGAPLPPSSLPYPSRSATRYGRPNPEDVDRDLPFADDRGSGDDGPWAFISWTPPAPRPSTHYIVPTYAREQLQTTSTVTDRERETFTKIFHSILSEKSSFAPLPRGSKRTFPNGDEISFNPKGPIDPSSATFGPAKVSNNEEYPLAVRAAAAGAVGLELGPWTDGQRSRGGRKRTKSFATVVKDMRRCQTDRELLRWLDNHVPSMVSSKDAEGERRTPPAPYPELS